MESNFTDLKTRTMEITNEQIKELKQLLWILDSKHNVSVPQTQENINYITGEIVKLFSIPKSLPEWQIYQKAQELDEKEFEQWMYDNQ